MDFLVRMNSNAYYKIIEVELLAKFKKKINFL